MLDKWTSLCLPLMDALFGWLLRLRPDAAIVGVAIFSALLLTLVRKFSTDQALLRCASRDTRRLKVLIREAKLKRDAPALARFRATKIQLSILKLRAEAFPLLLSLLPIAMLATWALCRLQFHPPPPRQAVELTLYTRASAEGEVAHLVPQEGLEAPEGWVRAIEAKKENGVKNGEAVWKIKAEPKSEPYKLTLRLKGLSFEHEMLVGETRYSPPVADHGGEVLSEVKLKQVKLFDVVPGAAEILSACRLAPGTAGAVGAVFPPWLVAYLLIVIPFVPVLKWVLRVY